jgi:hypothetical protein
MREEVNPDEGPLLQVQQLDLVITAVGITTSLQNCGFQLVNKGKCQSVCHSNSDAIKVKD